jgi:hypothetical protein
MPSPRRLADERRAAARTCSRVVNNNRDPNANDPASLGAAGSTMAREVLAAPGDRLDDFVRKEMSRWAKVIKDNNIKSGD